jgi:hypothetical protein
MSGYSGARRGRYRQTCLAECLGGDRRGSKLEGEVFQILSFLLPGGAADICFPDDRRLWIDMVFTLAPGFRLAIEYDGAYWHAEKFESDQRKGERLVGSGFVDDIVRLREEPLELTSPNDVRIRRGAGAQEIAALVLLHLLHHRMFQGSDRWWVVYELLDRKRQLTLAGIQCSKCRAMAIEKGIVARPGEAGRVA